MLKKDNEKALLLRKEGNEFYKEKKFFDALLKYNESLCYAEVSSEHIGFGFANRSAVYFEMKFYQKSLENIELAIKNNYPESSMEILRSRKEKCQKNLKNSLDPSNTFFRLSSKVNEKLPHLVNCLKFCENEKYGRHIVTSKILAVGEIIAIEKPIACVPIYKSNGMESNKFQRCNSCLRDNILDLIPCENCCDAMFCSQNCYKNALEKFHKYECKIMDQITSHANLNIILRIFFMGFSIFNENIQEFYKFYESTLKEPKTIFDSNFSGMDCEKDTLAALLSLSKSEKKFSLTNYFEILEKFDCFKGNREMIEKILQTICQISDHNFHGFYSVNLKSSGDSQNDLQQVVGSSANLFSSLMNHSCSPNVARICVDGKVAVVVCRPIPRGEQIFDCYKVNFLSENKITRQMRLKEEFNFTCDCIACVEDWPTVNALKIKNTKLLNQLKASKNLEKVFRDYAEMLTKEGADYPSRELCMIQKFFLLNLLKLTAPKCFFT